MNGSRYSQLSQITPANVGTLAPKWIYSLNTARLQVTPVVVEGVMYVTSANELNALDAGSGREIWRYQRPRTKGLIGNAAGGVNRGVGVAGDRVFMVTDHAHIIALNRHTGSLLWETEMADWRQNYNATGAPLPVGNLVITGTSGGDEGVRGFVAAFDQATGKEVWRFWTVPAPGERGSETWQGKGIAHPGGTTWMTGRVRSAARHALLAGRQSGPGSHRRRSSGRQPLHRLGRRTRSENRRAQVALPVHAARRAGTTTHRSRSPSLTPTGRASRVACWCRRIETASSMCSIARTARSSSARST